MNLQQSVLWAGPFVRFQPLTIGGLEPTISNANLVKQTMLGAPFSWPWNRAESDAIAITAGTQDYVAALPMWGFIEKAWFTETTSGETKELEVRSPLSKDSTKERPQFISVHKDDGQGNITFRLMPNPSKAGTLTVMYQQKAVPMDSLASRWTPIPDELSYIYNPGFLAMTLPIVGSPLFPIYNDRFISHLLGAQQGLDETQRAIFLAKWLDVMKMAQRAQMETSQGIGGRQK
jgi:hypothetical protein